MGTCWSHALTQFRRISCWKPKTNFEDRDKLLEFDMFLDEAQQGKEKRPVSLSSLESELLKNDQVEILIEEDIVSDDSDVLFEFGLEHEEVELHEETAIEACKEAIRIKKLAQNNTELMNPAQLAFDNNAVWLGEDPQDWDVAGCEYNGTSNLNNTVYSPANPQKSAHRQTNCSSPSSSVELEWENEHGLSPVTHIPTDDISDTASCISQLSTPVSNGNEELEWDGHFTSTHISHLDMETERLITEIERLTSGVLQDHDSNS